MAATLPAASPNRRRAETVKTLTSSPTIVCRGALSASQYPNSWGQQEGGNTNTVPEQPEATRGAKHEYSRRPRVYISEYKNTVVFLFYSGSCCDRGGSLVVLVVVVVVVAITVLWQRIK